jgi:hypothetical protein
MAEVSCINQTGLPFVYDSPGEARDVLREVSDQGSKLLKDNADVSRHADAQFTSAEASRANQDRWIATEFTQTQVAAAQVEARLQKDNVDAAQWNGARFAALEKEILTAKFDLSTAVERNGRSAELATEKTAAATIREIDLAKAEAAKCCCETEMRIAASTAAILAAISAQKISDLERQVTVAQIVAQLRPSVALAA